MAVPEVEFIQRDRGHHPPALSPGYKTSVLRSPRLALWSLQNSLSEFSGPVFGREELGPLDHDLLLNYAKTGESPSGSARSFTGGCSMRTDGAFRTPWSRCGRPMQAVGTAVPLDGLAYRFDIVLRGTRPTLFENKLQGN